MLPVLIAGAGPTGLTAALELSRFGIPVRIVDKLPQPRTSSRAIGVQARTLELMEQRGLVQEMLACGHRGRAVNVYGNGQRAIHLEMSRIESRFNMLLLLSQAETERILTEAIGRRGVQVERGVELIGIAQAGTAQADAVQAGTALNAATTGRATPVGTTPGGASPAGTESAGTAGAGAADAGIASVAIGPGRGGQAPVRGVLRHPDGRLELVDASWLISAEGAHSLARSTLGIPFEGSTLPSTYAVADVAMDPALPMDELHAFASDCGLMAVFPLDGGNRVRIVATDSDAGGHDLEKPPPLATVQRLYDQSSHFPARLSDLIWSSWFRINSRMVGRLRVGRVLLGGDSAHIHSPIGGQGMNTGIHDMINLSWKLALVMQGRADAALLDTYEQERLPVMRSLLAVTEEVTRVMGSGSAFVRSVLTHLGPWVGASGMVQGNAAARLSQIGLGYRDSPLSANHRPSGSLHAGDRVPDMAVEVLHSGPQGAPHRGAGNGEDGEHAQPGGGTPIAGGSEEGWRPAALHCVIDASAFVLLLTGDTTADLPPATRIRTAVIRPTEDPASVAQFRAAFGRAGGAFLVRPDGYLALACAERGAADQIRAFGERWLRADLPAHEPEPAAL